MASTAKLLIGDRANAPNKGKGSQIPCHTQEHRDLRLPREVPARSPLILGVWTEMSSTEPKAPGHLKAETRRWWAEVAERWDLEEHHRRILTLCAEAWDTGQAAGALLRREGLVVTTKDGGPAHPAVKIQPERPAAILPRHSRARLNLEPPAGSEATARAAGQSRGKWRAPKTASRESADDGHEVRLYVWQWLDFTCGWCPGTREADTWATFADFLNDYCAIRTEFRRTRWGADPSFAERLLTAVEAGEDVERASDR